MPGDLLYFSGADYEPVDSPSWRRATREQRQAYYARLGDLIHAAFDRQLASGVGLDGQPLAPRQHPRSDGANGPPLTPHRQRSRTRRLLAHWATDKGVRFNWRGGWRRILDYHGEGMVIGAYIRDVRGVTRQRVTRSVTQARAEWAFAHPFDRLPPAPSSAAMFLPRSIVPINVPRRVPAARSGA